LIIADLGYPV